MANEPKATVCRIIMIKTKADKILERLNRCLFNNLCQYNPEFVSATKSSTLSSEKKTQKKNYVYLRACMHMSDAQNAKKMATKLLSAVIHCLNRQ